MGQAKNRGSREQRIAEAQDARKMRLHAIINETRMDSVLLANFPCAECGSSITPDPSKNEQLDTPVRHGVQVGECQNCRARHLVVSAANKQDCIALEPVLESMKRSFSWA